MKRCKSAVLIMIICVMFLACGRMNVNAEIVTGTNGKNITWKVENGVLTISGKGDMLGCGHSDKINWFVRTEWWEELIDCKYENVTEWWNGYYFREDIKHVVIEEGITSIAPHIFSYMKKRKP